MRKLILILIILPFAAINLEAQVLKYGIKAGLNLSNISVSPEADPPAPTMRPGVHFGATLKYGLADKFNISPEILFSFQGGNDSDPDVDQFVKLTYLNIPVMFEYLINENIHVFAGPQIGFLTGGELLEEDKVSGEQDIFDPGNVMNSIDFGLNFGAGYLLDNGLEISARYNLGLTNINNDNLGAAFYDPNQEVKNRVIQFSLAYYFSKN